MKRIFFTLIILFTMSANAQIVDTVKVMNVHTKYYFVEEIEVSRIKQINFYDDWMNVSNNNSFFIDHIDYVDFSEKVYHEKINVTPKNYNRDITRKEIEEAIDHFRQNRYLNQCTAGVFMMRGGKEGATPGAHAYQRQYSFGTDLYAQYFTIPHKDFMYGSHTSTYDVSAEFNNTPLGSYNMVKGAFMPALNDTMINCIPEIKAILLLYYCISAQENADLSGPYSYVDDVLNKPNTTKYDGLKSIYYNIVNSLDNIIACLENYETRPEWYKETIQEIIMEKFATGYNLLVGDMSLDSYIKLANSLKLRMAMHIVKVEPETAQRWAEEAVAGGVIEDIYDQHGVFPMIWGFTHPLVDIANSWGDLRLCASFESLMMSLDHPYSKYLFEKNAYDIPNKNGIDVLKAGTRICGIRAGILVGDGQTYALNKHLCYSSISTEALARGRCPLYFIKWAEVDFLRAEGALRGWNMGGTAQEFYERGIMNAYIEDPMSSSKYLDYVSEYMQREEPIAYVNVDPMGDGEPWPSVTKIGVKWNDTDDKETKLEKIITQKYLALFPLSTEAWTELRRTGYPKLFPVLNTNDGDGSIKQGDMIRRIPWAPKDETTKNIIETSGIKALGGPDEQATRLWWDVDKANF